VGEGVYLSQNNVLKSVESYLMHIYNKLIFHDSRLYCMPANVILYALPLLYPFLTATNIYKYLLEIL